MGTPSSAGREACCCPPLPACPASYPAPLHAQTQGSRCGSSVLLSSASEPHFCTDHFPCRAGPSFHSFVLSFFFVLSPPGNNQGKVPSSGLPSPAPPPPVYPLALITPCGNCLFPWASSPPGREPVELGGPRASPGTSLEDVRP